MNSFNSIFNNFYFVLSGPILIFTLIIIAWFRTGTIISLLERLWRLIVGKTVINDKKLMQFNKDMRDIEQFNFIYGLKVKSIEQMHQIIEWIDLNKLSFIDVSSAKKWINIQTMTIDLPSENYVRRRFIGFLLCAVILIFSSISFGPKSALLQFKTSKTWFYLDQDKAQGFMKNWILEANQCNDIKANESLVDGLTLNEKQVICETFKNKELPTYLEKILSIQRTLLGILCFVFMAWMISLVKQTKSYHDAQRLKKTI